MVEALKKSQPVHYDTDFYAWTIDQAAVLRQASSLGLDRDHLAEEIEGLGDSHRDEIESRLAVLPLQLLKWQFQPDRRSNSWRGSIFEQRSRVARRLRRSPSLKAYPGEVIADEYPIARLNAAGETGLDLGVFPQFCPYSVEDALDPNFYPESED